MGGPGGGLGGWQVSETGGEGGGCGSGALSGRGSSLGTGTILTVKIQLWKNQRQGESESGGRKQSAAQAWGRQQPSGGGVCGRLRPTQVADHGFLDK